MASEKVRGNNYILFGSLYHHDGEQLRFYKKVQNTEQKEGYVLVSLVHISEIKLFALKRKNYSMRMIFSETPVL